MDKNSYSMYAALTTAESMQSILMQTTEFSVCPINGATTNTNAYWLHHERPQSVTANVSAL